jgi:hypothetical protein
MELLVFLLVQPRQQFPNLRRDFRERRIILRQRFCQRGSKRLMKVAGQRRGVRRNGVKFLSVVAQRHGVSPRNVMMFRS